MKKIVLALILLSTIFAASFAQEYDIVVTGEEALPSKDNEVYFSVGSISTLPVGLTIITFGLITLSEGDSLPVTFTAGYNHYFKDGHLGVGGFASYERLFGMNAITLQAKITGQYGWERFKFYHSASLGYLLLTTESKPTNIVAFDATLLGIKLDFENFNIFAELSFPTTAIVKAGASFKF